MIRQAISQLLDNQSLTAEQAEGVMNQIMGGEATPAQIAGFLVALRVKGETVDEITGCARAMRRASVRVTPRQDRLIDTCGTGGDGAGTFNISTTTAFVVAGAGLHVAKHGNRSVSSRSGSADVLTALGVMIGVAAVIALVALGNGAQQSVEESLQSLGSNLLILYSGSPKGSSLVRRNTTSIAPAITAEA